MSANDPKRTSRVDRRFAWPPACSQIAWKEDPAFFSWDTPCGNWTQPIKETALTVTCCYWTIVPRSVIRSHKRWVHVVRTCRSFPSRRASNALRRQAARSGWASSLHEGTNTEKTNDQVNRCCICFGRRNLRAGHVASPASSVRRNDHASPSELWSGDALE